MWLCCLRFLLLILAILVNSIMNWPRKTFTCLQLYMTSWDCWRKEKKLQLHLRNTWLHSKLLLMRSVFYLTCCNIYHEIFESIEVGGRLRCLTSLGSGSFVKSVDNFQLVHFNMWSVQLCLWCPLLSLELISPSQFVVLSGKHQIWCYTADLCICITNCASSFGVRYAYCLPLTISNL